MIDGAYVFSDGKAPILALSIHDGHCMPEELLSSCGISDSTRLREEDPFTSGFAGLFPNYIIPHTSRFAIDLNRPPEKAVYLKPEDAWGLPVRKSEVPPDLLLKLRTAHDNWYKIAEYQIKRMLSTHSQLLVLDLHSYNHRRGGIDAAPDPQIDNPDIIIGRNNICKEQYPLVDKLQEMLNGALFQGTTIDCRCDVKFTGGYFPRWVNSTFPGSCLCLAIEFKKIFMNEWTGELDLEAYDELRHLFHSIVTKWAKL
ncbi:MAG: hypothetical protein CVU50_05660 [Candidatus Cloacimonetes bacterium HGW-Cloacimonetes-3]|jgi:N-formylglutamate amidohydrolase|nr:MAG: hypothetical protein CVU50_05660 [Candidatus Cloacimonetes bacterium HGW-Cloacimonetes-3]